MGTDRGGAARDHHFSSWKTVPNEKHQQYYEMEMLMRFVYAICFFKMHAGHPSQWATACCRKSFVSIQRLEIEERCSTGVGYDKLTKHAGIVWHSCRRLEPVELGWWFWTPGSFWPRPRCLDGGVCIFFIFFFALEHFQDFLKWPHQSFESIFFQPPFQVGFSYHTIIFTTFITCNPQSKCLGCFLCIWISPTPLA